jgi:prepilin-type N-terminal cleavage/methylation domain-containing protein
MRTNRQGFTLIESVVGVSILLIISSGMYQTYTLLTESIRTARARVVALTIINNEFELIRNLQYNDVGIQGSLPPGKLLQTSNISRGGFDFLITRTVRNVDDPFDGTVGGLPTPVSNCQVASGSGGGPNDFSSADYRCVQIVVTCPNCKNFTPVSEMTTAAPVALEGSSNDGALRIQVFNANGQPVPQANVHIENKMLASPISYDDVTNNDGIVFLVGVPPSVGGYHASSTKAGYSADYTSSTTPTNPNPILPYATVAVGAVTELSLAIDQVSSVQVGTSNNTCVVIPNASFYIDGAKLLGTGPDILKYSLNTQTDAGGSKLLTNLEWDSYKIIVTDVNYDLAGSIPLAAFNLPPNTTQNLQFILEPKAPKSFLVTVKDNVSKLPVTGATVQMDKGVFSEQIITGRGARSQTDWSGGPGQTTFTDPQRYFDSDGNIAINNPAGELALLKIGLNYQISGELTSSTFDTGSASNFQNITWLPASQPALAGTDPVKFQVASNNDNTAWSYKGPDDTASTYYTLSNTNISNHNGNRFFRYKIFLSTADQSVTPTEQGHW